MSKLAFYVLFIIAAFCFNASSFAAKPSAKATFLNELRALVVTYNAQIMVNRQRIIKISEQYLNYSEMSEADFNWLKKTATHYQLMPKQRNDPHFFKALLARVDVIPPNLILALAVAEGAWQYSDSNPKKRFLCLTLCTQSVHHKQDLEPFFLTINTHAAYLAFREQRVLLRQQQKPLTGQNLIDSLSSSPVYAPTYKITKKILTTRQWQKLDNL